MGLFTATDRLESLSYDPVSATLGLLDGIRLGRRRGGKLRSFFSHAIAPKTFLREVPLTLSVRGSAWSWQTDCSRWAVSGG